MAIHGFGHAIGQSQRLAITRWARLASVMFCEAGLAAGLLSHGHHGRAADHNVGRPGRCRDDRHVVDVVPISPLDPTTTSQPSMAPLFVASESMTSVAVARVMPLCLTYSR